MPIARQYRHFYAGPQWLETRARILERAGYRCEACGAAAGALAWSYRQPRRRPPAAFRFARIQLGVAHLNHEPGDDRAENLAALCRRCHLAHDKGQHKHTRATRKDRGRPLLLAIAS